ncbi:MAG: thioredoxin [Planctomycetes bacterium]|nr:thioredoxin [Planctomycetota bacterium]
MSSSQTAPIINVGEEDFERAVIEQSHERPVIVDFWAPWCPPCRMLAPLLEKLVRERGGAVVLAKVNLDQNQNLAAAFGVESIPAVKAFRDGKLVLEFVGLLPEDQLRQFLDQVSPTEADQLVRQAKELEASQPAEAEARYRRARELDRFQEAALVGLARLLVTRGQDQEAGEFLEQVGPGGELGQEAQRLQGLLFLRRTTAPLGDEASARRRLEAEPDNPQRLFELGCILANREQYPEALALLLSAAEKDRALAGSRVREVMVQIFQILGVRSPLADEYREKLAQVLY